MFVPLIAASAIALTFIFGSVYCDKKGLDYDQCVEVQSKAKSNDAIVYEYPSSAK